MNKFIEVFKGNEYRAKIENEIHTENIFTNIYKDANRILIEILNGITQFNKEEKEFNRYSYNGMCNNIIAFCGKRGQGKTSAMLSYSAFLKNKEKFKDKENINGKIKTITGLMNEKDKSKVDDVLFSVLEPIDPSSFSSNESIITVLLSRLFYKINGSKELMDPDYASKENLKKIGMLFQKCYSSANYIMKKQSDELSENDLDSLAFLGDSSCLKENLNNLIGLYLQLMLSTKVEDKYLVIQIDDADLASIDTFEFCEQIRVYLSIPNVIVLFATDYEQLENSIRKKYIEQNKSFITLVPDLKQDEHSLKMATKYLEKMLPSGHKVSLPSINQLISSDSQNISLKYLDMCDKPVFREIDKDGKIQEQLLKLLYLRTGVILTLDKNGTNPFLPNTLRQLTHLLKLFDDMYEIDFIKAYQLSTITSEENDLKNESLSELENVRENLAKLKTYFIYDWCSAALEAKQYETIKEIDEINKIGSSKGVFSKIKNLLSSELKKEYSHDNLDNYLDAMEMIDKYMIDTPTVQFALKTYFTIFLHEWFSYVVENQNNMSGLVEYIGNPFVLSNRYETPKKEKYKIFNFDFELNKMTKLLGKEYIDNGTMTFFKIFCEGNLYDADSEEDNIFEMHDDGNFYLEEGKQHTIKFNILQPIIQLLLTGVWKNFSTSAESNNVDSIGKTSEQDELVNIPDDIIYLISVRNALLNYDVWEKINQKIKNKIGNIRKRVKSYSWDTLYKEICACIDSWNKEDVKYIKDECNLGEKCYQYFKGNENTAKIVFFSNQDNVDKYIKEYLDKLTEVIDIYLKKISNHKEALILTKFSELIDGDMLSQIKKDLPLINKDNIQPMIIESPDILEEVFNLDEQLNKANIYINAASDFIDKKIKEISNNTDISNCDDTSIVREIIDKLEEIFTELNAVKAEVQNLSNASN